MAQRSHLPPKSCVPWPLGDHVMRLFTTRCRGWWLFSPNRSVNKLRSDLFYCASWFSFASVVSMQPMAGTPFFCMTQDLIENLLLSPPGRTKPGRLREWIEQRGPYWASVFSRWPGNYGPLIKIRVSIICYSLAAPGFTSPSCPY